ncbi:MAG TPA: hypothetical protein VJB92_02815 [Candidatus Paceibacterota bacterium]
MYHTIALHHRVHFEEILARWLVRRFGSVRFPGADTARTVFWTTGGTPDGKPAEEYERNGWILIGVGGGRFDEHPTSGSLRKEDHCAATLIAEELKVDDDPRLERILKFAFQSDRREGSHPFDLAAMVKALHACYPDNPERVIAWAEEAIEAKYLEQRHFWEEAARDFEQAARISTIEVNGKSMPMVVVVSESEGMNKFARSRFGGNAAIVVQKNPEKGNVQIFTSKKLGIDLSRVARALRLAEQQAKGQMVTIDPDALLAEGKVRGAEEWFYHLAGQMLLNGSLTAKDVPPTRLSLETIEKIIRAHLF